MTAADWDRVRRIYLEGIATGNATFEQDAPPWETWDASHRRDCRFVARGGGEVLGWRDVALMERRSTAAGR